MNTESIQETRQIKKEQKLTKTLQSSVEYLKNHHDFTNEKLLQQTKTERIGYTLISDINSLIFPTSTKRSKLTNISELGRRSDQIVQTTEQKKRNIDYEIIIIPTELGEVLKRNNDGVLVNNWGAFSATT